MEPIYGPPWPPPRAEIRAMLRAKYPDIGQSLDAHRRAQQAAAFRFDQQSQGPSLDDVARSLGRSAAGLERAVRALQQHAPVMPPQQAASVAPVASGVPYGREIPL